MKKNTFLGLDGSGEYCCLLYSHLSYDVISNNLADLEEDDFTHDSTNWNGCDEVTRTIGIKNLSLTGRKLYLPHTLVFSGEDDDMGHSYGWVFRVSCIAETNDIHIHKPAPVYPGPRDY